MLAMRLYGIDLAHWTTWLAVGVGIAVTGVVFLILHRRTVWRRRLALASREEDLPWEELLKLMLERKGQLAAAGAPLAEDLPPEQLLKYLLARLPAQTNPPRPEVPPDPGPFFSSAKGKSPTGRSRWGNPTEVFLNSPILLAGLHGLVVNRSTEGFAIFVDTEVQPETVVRLRAADAPPYVPWVEVAVTHCRKAGKNFLIACAFCSEIPWNVRVWFG